MTNPFLTKLKIYRFFDDFVIIYPLYALMFESTGLTISQISILLLTWSAVSFILEVPSGVLADKYDRKKLLILAQLFRVVGFSLWILVPNFWGFLAGFILWGIKSAFSSGTLEAFLYDGLKENKQEKSYTRAFGGLQSLSFIAILLASGTASIVFFLGYQLILVLSIVSLLISIAALITIKSHSKTKSTEEKEYFSLLCEGIQTTFNNTNLFIFVAVNALFLGAMAVDEYFSLYIQQTEISIKYVGYLFAFYSLIQALGSHFAHKLEAKVNLFLFLGLFNALLFLIGVVNNYFGVALFILLALVSSIGDIISNSAIQKLAKGHLRATIGSVSSFLSELVALTMYTLF